MRRYTLSIFSLALLSGATACATGPGGTNVAYATSSIRWGKPASVANFSGRGLNTRRWFTYTDLHPAAGHPRRSPKAVSVRGGYLRITGRVDPVLGDLSGGIGDRYSQTYGRWEVRFKVQRGSGYDGVILLWPKSGRWPSEGEIDLAEISGGSRTTAGEFLHYGADNHQAGHRLNADFTQWHVIAVDWLPDHITMSLDGHAQWTVKRNADPRKNVVPSTPFRLALQLDQGCGGHCRRDASTPKTVTMTVDWVRIYKVPSSYRPAT